MYWRCRNNKTNYYFNKSEGFLFFFFSVFYFDYFNVLSVTITIKSSEENFLVFSLNRIKTTTIIIKIEILSWKK